MMQVLIFSQFKIMLNVIEDSLGLAGYPCERIDGDVKAPERQAAIDRFMKGLLPLPSSAPQLGRS